MAEERGRECTGKKRWVLDFSVAECELGLDDCGQRKEAESAVTHRIGVEGYGKAEDNVVGVLGGCVERKGHRDVSEVVRKYVCRTEK